MEENARIDAIGRSLDTFFSLTRLRGLSCVSSLPDTMGPRERAAILSRKRCSWVNPRTGDACVYTPGVNGYDPAFWQSVVLYAGLEAFGLKDLCSDVAVGDALLVSVNRRTGVPCGSLEELETRMRSLIEAGERDRAYWTPVALGICSAFGLEADMAHMEWALRNGLKGYFAGNGRSAGRAPEEPSRLERVEIRPAAAFPKRLDLGPVCEPLRRLGYPPEGVLMDTIKLTECLKRYGVDIETFGTGDLRERFGDPLMVLRSDRPRSDGTYPYSVVLDKTIDVPGYGKEYLTLSVNPPEKEVSFCMEARSGGKAWHLCPYPLFFTEGALMVRMRKESGCLYLKSGDGTELSKFEMVDRLLKGKKNGAAPFPVETSGSNAQSLNSFANITEKFKNPMSCEEFFGVFGYERDPLRDAAERRASVEADMRRADREASAQAAVIRVSDSMNTIIPKDVCGKAALDRLEREGIHNAGDVVREGFDRVRELAGTDRALNRIASWLAGLNIFVYPKGGLQEVPDRPDADTVRAHLLDSLLKVASGGGGEVHIPRRLSGTAFTGSDAVHLVAAGACMGRRSFCPVWVTGGELASLGSRPGKAAAVPVNTGDGPEYVYNLAATDFPKRYPEEYRSYLESLRSERPEGLEMERYLSCFLEQISAGVNQRLQGLVQWMDGCDHGTFASLRAVHGQSLGDILGEDAMKEMRRKGKILRMYDAVSAANERVRSKSNGKK